MNKQTETDFDNFMKSFLTKGNKIDLGVPKRPTKAELETKHKIVKANGDFKFVKAD